MAKSDSDAEKLKCARLVLKNIADTSSDPLSAAIARIGLIESGGLDEQTVDDVLGPRVPQPNVRRRLK